MEHHEDEAWIYNGQEKVPRTVIRVKIAEGITEIPDNAFQMRRQLEEVILPSSVQKVEVHYVPRPREEVGIPSNVKVIDDWAFNTCNLLGRLVLNEGLERIGKFAFTRCNSLTEVETPSTVKVIDECAFNKCNLLVRLVPNEGLERIGQNAFLECESLSHVRVPRSVNSLATNAFTKCSSLISIELAEECPFNINLSRCLSLASLSGQISILFQDERRRE
eukprot:scaffold4728_cov76-Cylindrotheca_fusiformis.AAC.1